MKFYASEHTLGPFGQKVYDSFSPEDQKVIDEIAIKIRKKFAMNRESILIDFDGTIVEHKFPEIGLPMHRAFEVLKKLKDKYFIILWTCRENRIDGRKYLDEAVEFCRQNGIVFDAVNETILENDFRDYECPRRKPHVYAVIDDRNLGGFHGWDWVESELL